MHVAHLTPARLPLLRRPRRRAGAGGDGLHRPQRPGQDQPRRGDRLPLRASPRTGSPPTRRWSGPAPTRRSCAPRSCKEGRTALLEVELNPGRANRARINRSPLPRPREHHRPGAHRGLRARRPDPGQGRPVRPAQVPRRPAGAAGAPAGRACASDYDRILKQRNSLLKTAGMRPRRLARRGDVDARDLGRQPRPGRRRAPRAPGCSWSTTCAPTSARPTRPSPAGRSRDDADLDYQRERRGGRCRRPARQALLDADRRQAQGRARPRASPWSARTATSCCSPWPGRRRPAPAGQGLRLARGVVVLRARAPAGVVRPAARRRRRPDPGPRRRVRRARRRAPQPARRSSWPDAEQVLVTAAVAADVPESLQGVRYLVADGQVTRDD